MVFFMKEASIEECKQVVPNRFHLSVLTGHRARDISRGAKPLVKGLNKKSKGKGVVIALSEIANGLLFIDKLETAAIKRHKNLPFSSQDVYGYVNIDSCDGITMEDILMKKDNRDSGEEYERQYSASDMQNSEDGLHGTLGRRSSSSNDDKFAYNNTGDTIGTGYDDDAPGMEASDSDSGDSSVMIGTRLADEEAEKYDDDDSDMIG